MIQQAVVLAAGMGSRIRSGGVDVPKPLQEVDGIPLIKRTVLTLASVGIRHFAIVVGFRKDDIVDAVRSDLAYHRAGLHIDFVENAEYERANGLSVLVAAEKLRGPFLLSMCDHVYEPEIAGLLAHADMRASDLYLAVDRRLDEIYDMPDATKVRTMGGYIQDIGKNLDSFDCVDCGVFAVGPRLGECLAELRAAKGDASLSDGVKLLSKQKRARVVDIGSAWWQDVDTPEARERAELLIRTPPEDRPLRLVSGL
jgi:choline kinase